MTDPKPDLTELELREALYEAMDGNLRMSRRRELLGAYRDAILASAVSAVVPAADRAAVLTEVADRYQGFLDNADTSADPRYWTGIRDMVLGLRHIAAEAAVPVVGVAADTTPAETVHACPPDGSGLTPCCGRTPFELPRTDRISSEPDAVTCRPSALAQRCANCGVSIRQVTGTLTAWWVHDPDGRTACHPHSGRTGPRAEPGPVVPAQPGNDTKTRPVRCADAAWTDRPHPPHNWQQRPGAAPVRCPGFTKEA